VVFATASLTITFAHFISKPQSLCIKHWCIFCCTLFAT